VEQESIAKGIWCFFRTVLIISAAIVLVTGGSFLVLGAFSFQEYSARLFWGGIGAIIFGGFAVVASLGSYSTLGTPNVLTAPGDARVAHERIGEQIRMNAGRYMFSFRMFAAGALCIALSALVEVLSR
jgi:hypothetical protein